LPNLLAASKLLLLEQLRVYLGSLSRQEVVSELSPGPDGKPSRFRQLHGLVVDNLQASQSWPQKLWLELEQRSAGQIGQEMSGVRRLIDELQTEGVRPTREQYLDLIRAIFVQPGKDDVAVREQSLLAMHVIDSMFEQGEKVLDHDVFVTVMATLLKSNAIGDAASRLLTMFEHLSAEARLPCPSEGLLMQLLDAYASRGMWDKFWETWRIPPRFFKPRSHDMYTYLFELFARDRHQTRCIDALRWCVQEMGNENPPVVPDQRLLDAIVACIRVADPRAETVARGGFGEVMDAKTAGSLEFARMLRNLAGGAA
jgi:hypothetical protein